MNATHMGLVLRSTLVAGATLVLLSGCATTATWSGGLGMLGNCSNFKDSQQFTGEEDHGNLGLRVLGKYDPGMRERVVFEGGYTSLGDTDFDGLWNGVSDQGTIETDIIEANVGYRYPFTEKFSAGGRIGAAYVDVSETETYGGKPYSASASETIAYGGIVARYAFNKSWAVSAFFDHYPDIGKAGETGEGDAEVYGITFDFRFGGSNTDD